EPMSIRKKLQLSILVGGAMAVLVLGLIATWTSRQVHEAIEQSEVIHDVVRGVFELNIVTNDYLLHHEERAQAQWELRHGSLDQFLRGFEAHNSAEEEILSRIIQEHAQLQPLFSQLVTDYESRDLSTEKAAVSLDLEQRLVSQLLVKAQTMVADAFRLEEIVRARVESTQRRGNFLLVALCLPILGVIIVLIALVSNRIVAGITKLRQGTEIIGAGDLDYQVDVGSQDEIGDLAHAFNEMTHRLRQSYLEKSVMEAQLRQQQKLESIGTLASGVAHEINNPLMGIINYAELIEDEIENESVKAYTAGIIKEGNRVATIVRNLLSFARQDKESHSPADLKDIIDSSMSLVSSTLRKDQITIEVDVPDDLPNVKCRSQQIQQVVINLLTNAHDALNERYPSYDENKLIRISVQPLEIEGSTWVRMTIEDRGPGIPQDMIERIFDPFFTSKPRDEGTGLGLSVSFGIVREHKGRLLVESKLGEYTRFHMELAADNEWTLAEVQDGEA
ncbi:HAMP domain-containing protein, partial [Candidatus Bipolaricaulota bacterium]|nr:HAMP domain-containing protein [Candidatus Bipolaricaulota bacterium]